GSTHAWTRVDSGDPTHSISSASSAAPTFSIPSGHVAQSNTNIWQDTVTDGLGRVVTKQVTITLTVTTSGAVPLTAMSTPATGYKYVARRAGVVTWSGPPGANAIPNGGTPPYTHS